MKSLFLIDAYAIIYRSYFAFIRSPLRAPDGTNVSSIFGFLKTIFQLWDSYKPEYCAVVFDSRVPTFRHVKYPEYKATREKAPEDLHAQVPIIEDLITKLGIATLRVDGYEADDIIATLSTACTNAQASCRIVSGDKDLLQLVNEYTHVLRPDKDAGFIEVDAQAVENLWGVKPNQILEYLSLTGDTSDNVPGITGIGDKTAQKLIAQYGTLEAIIANAETIKPESLKAKIKAGIESARLSRELITLHTDVPGISKSLTTYAVSELNHRAIQPILAGLNMKSLMRDMSSSLFDTAPHTKADEAPQVSSITDFESSKARQYAALPAGYSCKGSYESITNEEKFFNIITQCKEQGYFAFDTETDSLDEHTATPVGFSIAVSPCSAVYVPVCAPDTNCIADSILKKGLQELFEDSAITVVGQNVKFDFHVLENWGINIHAKPWDTMIAAWLLDPELPSLKLEQLGKQYLDYEGVAYNEVVPKGSVFSAVPIKEATAYAAEDADMALRLYTILKPLLIQEELMPVFTDIEMPVLPILSQMERTGILINKKQLEQFGKELDTTCKSLEAEAYRLAGHEFNINSTKQLQTVLFEERKLNPGKKTKTGYSTDISVLEELAQLDPLPELILNFRTLQKLKNTYVDTLPEQTDAHGRLHTHFIQTGTATGRLSSRDPNLQNIPVREQEGKRIREAFIAEPGHLLVSADYSQIELVVLAHLSNDPALKTAFQEGRDIHTKTAALLFHKQEDEVTPSERRIAKTINFGVIYGMSAFRLARDLKISRTDANRFIEAYFATYKGISTFIQNTVEQVRKTGFVRTLSGRKRIIRTINSRNATERQAAERIAVNTPIQGTAADIVKKAMIAVADMIKRDWKDSRLLLQVHDELIVEVPEHQAEAFAQALKTCMENAWPLSVPLRVSISIGHSWGSME
ncbi:MAG TPA: DNA polymerase I [Spirochaetia bacterium]|nr:DNA polymerase I [Spirochaetales bacterium]HPD80544.1 DNA polymerase I [Spirochaetales bacterium]HQK34287.1 DNA polymerase I [Spirochaetales bacterium]HRS66146.1 DNA polymerase I [Spirochaetia bacterium]HRV27625.1 DNA polymerase I [Spirochaetia bacterium]